MRREVKALHPIRQREWGRIAQHGGVGTARPRGPGLGLRMCGWAVPNPMVVPTRCAREWWVQLDTTTKLRVAGDSSARGVHAASIPKSPGAKAFSNVYRNRSVKRRERRAPFMVVVSRCTQRPERRGFLFAGSDSGH